MELSLGMKMNNSNDWERLISQSLESKSGDIPNQLGCDPEVLGTKESIFNAGYKEISPKSPESPTKKQGRGNTPTLDAHGGEGFGQFNCDKKQDPVLIIQASDKGFECGQCDHLHMQVFNRGKGRRMFHWRCVKGFNIMEAHFGGERIQIAPIDCDQYQP
jgi:hypothetical protein